jgi:hypothetical protein
MGHGTSEENKTKQTCTPPEHTFYSCWIGTDTQPRSCKCECLTVYIIKSQYMKCVKEDEASSLQKENGSQKKHMWWNIWLYFGRDVEMFHNEAQTCPTLRELLEVYGSLWYFYNRYIMNNSFYAFQFVCLSGAWALFAGIRILNFIQIIIGVRDSSFSIATGYGLDGPGIESR